jgi:anthranilate synthase component 2
MARVLVLDNYDSFTHNLVQMFLLYTDLAIDVFRSDTITLRQIEARNPDYLVISPGPKDPASAGVSVSAVKKYAGKLPILGVCLGMQCINEAFGGKTVKSPVPVHGKTSRIYHFNQSVFKGMPSPFTGARYHSLMVDVCSDDLVVTAHSEDDVIMGIALKETAVTGVQFHPESFLTENGGLLIENFINPFLIHGPIKKSKNRAAA